MTVTTGRRGRGRLRRPLFALALVLGMLSVATVASADSHEEPFVPIELTFTITDIDQPGEATVSPEGIHVVGEVHSNSVTGSITGDALAVVNVDWAGPCDVEALTCEGVLTQWVDLTMTDDSGSWSGYVTTVSVPGETTVAIALLLGHGGNADHAILLDTVTAETEDSITISGFLVHVLRPQAGVTFSAQMCLMEDGSFLGGFLAGGILDDSGAAFADLAVIGDPITWGLVASTGFHSELGTIESLAMETINAQHAYGDVLILGDSGLYAGMYGIGHSFGSLSEDDRCASGVMYTSNWIGKVFWTRTLFEGELPALPVEEPEVYFASPEDGATVTSPVHVEMIAVNFTIEPAGEVHDGAGHFHIMVDVSCVTPGEIIPSDANHLHYGQGQTEADLELEPGEHTLCLQAGNGEHVALDLTDTIAITVEAGEDDAAEPES